jgi:hypothetical protein
MEEGVVEEKERGELRGGGERMKEGGWKGNEMMKVPVTRIQSEFSNA